MTNHGYQDIQGPWSHPACYPVCMCEWGLFPVEEENVFALCVCVCVCGGGGNSCL
jgi:hypothetical protein